MSRFPFRVEIMSSELTSHIRPRLGQVAASCTQTSKVHGKGSRFSESDFVIRKYHHHTIAHDALLSSGSHAADQGRGQARDKGCWQWDFRVHHRARQD
jgi:hypothetical protein